MGTTKKTIYRVFLVRILKVHILAEKDFER